MDRDELVLKRRSASSFTDFVFRRLVNDTKKKSSWAKRSMLCFACQGSIPCEIILSRNVICGFDIIYKAIG